MTSPLREIGEVTDCTKYAAPGNFMLGEIGRLNDVVFIETTQVFQGNTTPPATPQLGTNIAQGGAQTWGGQPARTASGSTPAIPAVNASPSNPNAPSNPIYRALVIGDNAAGHAISLPVELRDGGVLDFGYSAKQSCFALAA
ncbi:hypothetical protein [Streptomyces sp. NPDC088775]|uniref:hypothetical protein n=1 Tax=Streptomyces sp. NPDC088775 TaxID=3365896 RepID=UPI00382BCA43